MTSLIELPDRNADENTITVSCSVKKSMNTLDKHTDGMYIKDRYCWYV